MIWVVVFTVGAVLLSGLSIVTGAEFEQQVKAAEQRLLLQLLTFLPAREVGEPTARRMPSRVENEAVTGSAPGAASARLSAAAPGDDQAAAAGWPPMRACCLTTTLEPHTRECDEEAAAAQLPAPRHARPALPAPPVDLTKPAVYVETPDKPPWDTGTAAQPVLDDAAIAAIEAARTGPAVRPLALAGARGGCTGTTGELAGYPRLIA